MKTILYLMTIIVGLASCKGSDNKNSENSSTNYEYEETNRYDENDEEYYNENSDGYEDGTYSASVDYNNPETGYSTSYTLDVEVEDNHVTIIYFPNGGYLDDDHIWPGELDEQGFVRIEGEDGKTYDVQIDE